jgi:hypothetical protein
MSYRETPSLASSKPPGGQRRFDFLMHSREPPVLATQVSSSYFASNEFGAQPCSAADYAGIVTADGGPTAPYSPPGGPFTPQPGSSAPPQPLRAGGGRRPRGGGASIALGIVAIVLAVAALVVALVRGGELSAPATPTARPTTPSTPTSGTDTAAADKALCEAIAPLMAESNKQANDWVGLGEQGSPARDAALSKFVGDTRDWVRRAQMALDTHAGVNPFLGRSLQRYIDDLALYITNVSPGPKQVYDSAAWNDSLVAYGAPKSLCRDLGINW